MDFINIIQTIASIATACGVGVTAGQLYQARKQARTQFEDSLTKQYLDIEADLPFEAMLGNELGEVQQQQVLPLFYRYFNLCNEQIMWRRQGRICKETWRNWQDGMWSNFARPAFAAAWEEIQRRSSNFKELRYLERQRFSSDPRKWRRENFEKLPSMLAPTEPTSEAVVIAVKEERSTQQTQEIGHQ